MKYYILTQDVENDEEDAIISGYSEYLDRVRLPFETGEELPLEDILVPIQVQMEIDSLRGRMTDALYIDDVDCLIISKKVSKILKTKYISDIQVLPISLIDPYSNADAVEEAKLKNENLDYKEVIYDNYAIINVISLLDCVDHLASHLEYFVTSPDIPEDMPEEMKAAMQQEEDNDIDFIRKLVLDETKIPDDIKIFRLKDCPRILVFKEEIVQAIREEGLTGFVFVPLSEYTDEIPDDDDEENEDSTDQKIKAKEPEPTVAEIPPALPPETSKKSITIKRIKRN